MNWTQPKEILSIKINNINNKSKGNDWSKKRLEALVANDYTCTFCGAKYLKYLIGIPCNDDIKISCRACYLITHINMGFNNEIMLCYSKLSQTDIVKKTVNYIIKNDTVPLPTEIDENARLVNLTIMELSNLLSDPENIVKKLQKFNRFKIFFTQEFDTTFIQENTFSNKPMFIDDSEDHDEAIYSAELLPEEIYKFNKKEHNLLKKYFT